MPELTVKLSDSEYKPSEDEQKALDWVYKRFQAMKDSPERIAAEKEWYKGDKLWESLCEDRAPGDWMSNYKVPLVPAIIESILSEFVDQQQRPLILGRGQEDEAKAMVLRHTYDFTWDQAYGDLELINLFKTALIRGTAIAQEYYLRDRRLIKQIIGLNKKAKGLSDRFETKEQEVFEYDDCMLEEVQLEDFFVDEMATELNRGSKKARDCIRRYRMNIRDYRQFFTGPVWDPVGNAKYVKPGGELETGNQYRDMMKLGDEDVGVLWYWSRRPEDSLIIVANGVVQRMGPNILAHKQLPFGKLVDVNRINRFYGKGEPMLLESIASEQDTIRRMTLDRHHLDIDKSFLVSGTTMLDDDDLMVRPHNIIEVDDPKNVVALEYGDIPMSVQYTTKAINEDAVRVTGVDDRFQSAQKTPSTATEAAILKESTLKRIKMKIVLMQKGFLTDVAKQRVYNIMQFYSQPKLERIVGEAGTKQYKEQITKLMSEGLLTTVGGQPMGMKYRTIRIKGKKIERDVQGNLQEVATNPSEFSFFEVRPEDFLPTAGGFDIRFEGGATLAISKPLQQSKAIELYNALLPLTEQTGYDAEKLGDYLVRVNDMNPDELKKTESVQTADVANQRLEMALQIAGKENEMVLAGQQILPNGTPYAPPAHTEVHIAFLKSQGMVAAPQATYDALVRHITGEMAMQDQRGAQGGDPSQAQLPVGNQGMGSQTPSMGDAVPGRMEGGGEVPTGQAVNPTMSR